MKAAHMNAWAVFVSATTENKNIGLYGDALKAAGVDVDVKRYPGMILGFFNMLTEEPVDQIIMTATDTAKILQKVFDIS